MRCALARASCAEKCSRALSNLCSLRVRERGVGSRQLGSATLSARASSHPLPLLRVFAPSAPLLRVFAPSGPLLRVFHLAPAPVRPCEADADVLVRHGFALRVDRRAAQREVAAVVRERLLVASCARTHARTHART